MILALLIQKMSIQTKPGTQHGYINNHQSAFFHKKKLTHLALEKKKSRNLGNLSVKKGVVVL